MSVCTNMRKVVCLALIILPCCNISVSGAPVFTNVVDSTMTRPDDPSTFSFTSYPPSIDGPNIAFSPNGSAIYSTTIGGSTTLIAKAGTPAGSDGAFSSTTGRIYQVSGDNVILMATTTVGGQGIYAAKVGVTGLTPIANSLTPVPGDPTRKLGSFQGSPSVSGLNVVFDTGDGTYTAKIGSPGITTIVNYANTFPGQTIKFGSPSGSPAIDGNRVVSVGRRNPFVGLYTSTFGVSGINRVIDSSMPAPGQTVPLGNIWISTISGDNIAFAGTYISGQGVYRATFGTEGASRIADSTFIVPGRSTNFLTFGHANAGGNKVVFDGTWAGSNNGIFLYSDGDIFPIISTGDTLFGSAVTYLHLSQFGYDYVNNNVAFFYILANGTSGIAVADISMIPEPATISLLGIGGALLVRRRRV